MAINIISQPPIFSFAGNQVVFELESNNSIDRVALPFAGGITYDGQWFPGTVIDFRFGDEYTSMTANSNPDDSGTQFPANHPDLGMFVQTLVPYFRKNYILNKYYDIQGSESLDYTRLLFTAKEDGAFCNLKTSGAQLNIDTLGQDAKERDNFKFLFEVFLENEAGTRFNQIYSEKLNPDLPFSGKLTIDIHEILESALAHDVPNPNNNQPFRCRKSKRRFFCRYAEIYGNPAQVQGFYQTDNFHISTGGFSYIGFKTRDLLSTFRPYQEDPRKDCFLKQGTRILQTRLDQPEFLYFINFREARLLYFNTVVTYSDGSKTSLKVVSVYVEQYEKIAFASGYDQQLLSLLQPGKIPVKFTCALINEGDERLSEIITYSIVQGYKPMTRFFLYSSSLGAFDTFLAAGKGSEGYLVNQEQAEHQSAVNYDMTEGTMVSYDLSLQRNYIVNTGWIEKKVFDGLADFFISDTKFLYAMGKLLPVSVTNKKAGEYNDDTSLIKQDISISMNFNDYKFTAGDMEGVPSFPPPVTGLVHFGYCSVIPVTEADIKALPNSQPDSILTFTLNTGLNKRFCVALPASKMLHEAYDQTSEEDVTSEYLVNLKVIQVDGIPYNIATMEMAVSYSINHEHIIKAVNV